MITLAEEYLPLSCGQWCGIGIASRLTDSCWFWKHSASFDGTIIGSLGFSIAQARVSMYSSGVIPIAAHKRSLVSRFTAAL